MNSKPVNLNEIVRRIDDLLSRIIGEDIKLQTVLSEKDQIVMADPGQIEQVLMNLATNARDAMPGGGLLTIQTETVAIDHEFIKGHGFGKEGPYVLLSLTDTGAGMDRETREKIFEPFFTTKEVGKGTGLGLSMWPEQKTAIGYWQWFQRNTLIRKQKEHFYIFRLLPSKLHKTHKTTTILLQCLYPHFCEKLFSYLV